MNFILLPDELKLLICSFLNIQNLEKISEINDFEQCANDNCIWYSLIEKDFNYILNTKTIKDIYLRVGLENIKDVYYALKYFDNCCSNTLNEQSLLSNISNQSSMFRICIDIIIENNEFKILNKFMDKIINQDNLCLKTLIFIGCNDYNLNIIDYLLQLDLKINVLNNTIQQYLLNRIVYYNCDAILEYILKKINVNDYLNGNTFDCAAINNSVDCMEILYKNNFSMTENTIACASTEGNFDALKWLHEHNCPWNVEVFIRTGQAGQLECLKYLHENRCPYSSAVMTYIARSGHFECLKWLYEHGCSVDNLALKYVCDPTKNRACYDYVIKFIFNENY